MRLLLPPHGELGQEVVARSGALINSLISGVAVVSNRRGVDQEAGPIDRSINRFHDLMRAVDAAIQENLLVGGIPPAVGDAGAGEVNDGVTPIDRILPGTGNGGVAPNHGDSLVGGSGKEATSPSGVARNDHDLIISLQAIEDESSTNEACRARNEYLH